MGLLCVKAIKPAAGENFKFGGDYTLNLADVGFNDGGVIQLFSLQQTNSANLVMNAGAVTQLESVNLTVSADVTLNAGAVTQLESVNMTASADISFIGS